MINRLIFLLVIQLVCLCITVQCQNQTEVDKDWKWIIPLVTKKVEIEKQFGESITKDKTNPFQTYVVEFGKITVTYTKEKEFVKECSCSISADTVLEIFISTKRFKLSDLNYDLSKFIKDDTFSPREISYFSEKIGVLIVTEIVELEDKSKVERVTTLEYRPIKKK